MSDYWGICEGQTLAYPSHIPRISLASYLEFFGYDQENCLIILLVSNLASNP